jgi:FkbM family methyltransferase
VTVSRKRAVRGRLSESVKHILTPARSGSSGFEAVPDQVAPHDEDLLSRARAQWQYGDWGSLLTIDRQSLQHHPDRARLALLVASAHQQQGDADATKRFARLAMDWGCEKQLVGRLLIAGVFNLLGRAAAVGGHEQRARRHFELAIGTADRSTDAQLLGHARSVHEMVSLGMLPQAAGYVRGALNDFAQSRPGGALRVAHQKVIDLEVDWLRDRIIQLQKRMDQSGQATQIVGARASPGAHEPPKAAQPTAKKYYGLHGLDRKLEAYIDYDDGFFVELGANDGIAQSNTLYFERERRWRGVLIEPILHNFLKCKQNRSAENRFYCAACVSSTYDKPYVELIYANLMTAPSGVESDIADPVKHAQSGTVYLPPGEDTVSVMAVARTLGSILAEASAPKVMDLLSLDVEGAELEVLKGIDHAAHRFRFVLVETRNQSRLANYLEKHGYVLLDKLSQHDFLYALR